jgi:hypothetical protein
MAKVDETNPINKQETKLLQQVCGKFLYYARAVDTTMLHPLNDLATQTTKGTEKTMEALTGFRLWRQYWRHFWGYIFFGAYFPQKWDLMPPFSHDSTSFKDTCLLIRKKM